MLPAELTSKHDSIVNNWYQVTVLGLWRNFCEIDQIEDRGGTRNFPPFHSTTPSFFLYPLPLTLRCLLTKVPCQARSRRYWRRPTTTTWYSWAKSPRNRVASSLPPSRNVARHDHETNGRRRTDFGHGSALQLACSFSFSSWSS